MLNSHPAEGETPSFKGSMVTAVAESAEEVREVLSRDIYAQSGVWDLERMEIIPVSGSSKGEEREGLGDWLMVISLNSLLGRSCDGIKMNE